MSKKKELKKSSKNFPTLKIIDEKDIALDFGTKVYQKFDKIIKSVILFGSQVKGKSSAGSDIDIILIVDDVSVAWDQELTSWYREELGKIIQTNPYKKELHINSVRLSTWWQDMLRGDPVVVNVIRYGNSIIDFGGFFTPLKVLLQQGKIKNTPEAIYTNLQRAPLHIARSRENKLNTIEGLYWAMVDSAHAALMAARQSPPSPEHIPIMLKEFFVDTGNLKLNFVTWMRDLYIFHRKIVHKDINNIKGQDIDEWERKTKIFVDEMFALVKKLLA